MEIVPPGSGPETSPIASLLALLPLFALRTIIVNPFLAFTTMFPFIVLMEGTRFTGMYVSILTFIAHAFFHKSLEDVSMGNLIAIFFAVVLILTFLLSGVEKIIGTFNTKYQIDWRHVIAFMTVIYGLAWFASRHQVIDNSDFLFFLVFYLFNVYAIVAYHYIGVALQKLRESQPVLKKII